MQQKQQQQQKWQTHDKQEMQWIEKKCDNQKSSSLSLLL